MKTQKNLMVLVLLSLFLSVGVADSDVTDVNATVEVEDPFAGLEEAFNEFDKSKEEEKKWTEELKRSEEELKRSKESLEAAKERERIVNLAIAGS